MTAGNTHGRSQHGHFKSQAGCALINAPLEQCVYKIKPCKFKQQQINSFKDETYTSLLLPVNINLCFHPERNQPNGEIADMDKYKNFEVKLNCCFTRQVD